VGGDDTHLSLFEMPAAFIFGNKKEIAIRGFSFLKKN
jgi:hypothetical protein